MPQSEAAFMGGCEYGEFAACGFSCLNPLVSIQLGRIKYIIIFNGADTVVALSVADAVEYVEVIMKYGSHFRLMPFQLMRFGYNDFRLCNTQYTVHKEEKGCI